MADSELNSTSAALLGLLHDGPMTGGDLVAAAEARLGAFWSVTRSQVYRELPALAERGLLRLGKAGARSSQPYAITAAGKKAFSRWLSEPPGRDHQRNQLLLRTSFGSLQTARQRGQLFEIERQRHEEQLARLRQQARQDTTDPYATATISFAITYERALLKWLDALTPA
ncbi:MAG: PadR family transcriptional regulator [Actinomycetota bacterium]|nr:PadR family transcriptional regulator [Actinomycetota bacterium]